MERTHDGLVGYSPRVRLIGASLWIAWITLIYSSEPMVAGASDVLEITSLSFVVSTFALAVSLLVSSVFPGQARICLQNSLVMKALSCAGALSTLVVINAGLLPVAAIVAAAAVTGLVTSFIALRAAELFAEIDTKNMLIAMCAVLMLGVLVYSFSVMLVQYGFIEAVAVILVLLLPLSVYLLYLDVEDLEGEPGIPYEETIKFPRSFWRLITYIVILMFVLSVIRGYYPNLIDANQFAASRGVVGLGLLVGSVIITIIVAKAPRNASFGTLCYALFSLSVLVVPLMTMLGIDPTSIGNVSAVLFGTSLVCVWGLSGRISYLTGCAAIRVIGMSFGAACMGATLGFATGLLLYGVTEGQGIPLYLSGGSLVACVLAACFLLRKEDVRSLMQPSEEDLAELDAMRSDVVGVGREDVSLSVSSDYQSALLHLCGLVALERGLSPREADVLPLLASGQDAKSIGEELCISFNTVRTHIKGIYRKLDVHSRQEMMKYLEEEGRRFN